MILDLDGLAAGMCREFLEVNNFACKIGCVVFSGLHVILYKVTECSLQRLYLYH